MKLTPEDITRVCKLVDELAGIQWDASKAYLIESRLASLLKDHQCADLAALVAKVRANTDPRVRPAFIDAITTRETLFFRDESPFDALKHKAVPEIIDAKSKTPYAKRLRFWSAACSSGQEPYSIGITLTELLDDIDDWDIQILATDISPSALEVASKGVYSEFEMSRGVSTAIRDKYFRKVPEGWKICDEIRSLVSFQTRNLLQPLTALGMFDVIFCRNVAIYFDAPVKKELFERLAGCLPANGVLFVGSSENLSCFGERWKPLYHCRGVYYQPNQKANPTPTAAASSPKAATISASAQLPTKPSIASAVPQPMTARKAFAAP